MIVDTSVLAAVWLPAPTTADARAVLRRHPGWVVPFLWRYEFNSVLWKHVRAGLVSLDDAIRIGNAARNALQGREFSASPEAVLRLAAASDHSSYDCEFVALARQRGARVVTADRRLVARFPDDAVLLADAVAR